MGVYKHKRSPFYHYDFVFRGQRFTGSTNCSSKREAEAYERRIRHEVANPVTSKPPITLDEACGLYADHAEQQTSWATTEYILAAIVDGLGGKHPLSAVTQRDLQLHIAKRRNGRSNATINREIDVMRAVWWRASRARYDVGDMPDWKALYLKVAQSPPRELAQGKEQDALLDAIADDARDVVMFALISGWRRAEIIGLRWSDLDLGRGTARTRIKGGDVRSRALNAALVALIANQPKVGPFVFTYECRKTRRGLRDAKGRLQPARLAGHRYPMTTDALRRRWYEARAAIELEGFRFHDLRHTAATRILRSTQNLAATAKVLEHSNLNTTRRYAHVLDDDVRRALDAGMSRIIPELPNAERQKG